MSDKVKVIDSFLKEKHDKGKETFIMETRQVSHKVLDGTLRYIK